MKFLAFIFALASAHSFAAVKADLICKQEGEAWRPYNIKTLKWIGTAGASTEEICKERYLGSLNQNVMCVWESSERYRPYNAETGAVIGEGASKLPERCGEYVKSASNGVICVYTSTDNFNAFRISDGVKIGEGFNSSSLERCQAYLATYGNGLMCHYAGMDGDKKKFLPYKISTNKPYGFPAGTYAPELEQCESQIKKFELTGNALERDITAQVTSLKTLLAGEFKPQLKKLSRNVFFYSYYQKSELGFNANLKASLNSPTTITGLEKWRSAFDQHIPFEKGWLGYGLYGAANPVDSTAYASGDWLLSEIEMSKGATFLDLRMNAEDEEHNYSLHFSDAARDRLMKTCRLDAGEFTSSNFKVGVKQYEWRINKVNFNRSRICHEALTSVLKDLGVEFMVYNWFYVKQNNLREFDGGCDVTDTPAVVFTQKLKNPAGIKVFDKNGNDSTPDEYRRIFQLARSRAAAPVASWPQFRDASAVKVNMDEERKHQFGCRSEFAEDQPLTK